MSVIKSKLIFSLIMCMGLYSSANAFESHCGFTGLNLNKSDAYQGYTLITPFNYQTKEVYLIDMNGQKVHQWTLPSIPFYAELLDNGNILVAVRAENCLFTASGGHGRLLEVDWDGNIVMDITKNSPDGVMHHGYDRMPNGNTMVLTWEWHSWEEAIKKGRDPKTVVPRINGDNYSPAEGGIWPVNIVELDPKGNEVWKWRSWDHIGMGPDKMNINFVLNLDPKAFSPVQHPTFNYFNGVRYNEKLDKVLVTCRNFGEVLIIDRKTGKIEWRFGNPGTWGGGKLPGGYGDNGDQQLFGPHDPHWLPNGNISVFNNGANRPDGNGSEVVEIDPKQNKVVWNYMLPKNVHNSFASGYQSAAQPLSNGNYFVTSTHEGHLFEITPAKEVVWEYINPIFADGPRCMKVPGDYTSNQVHRAFRYGKDHPGLKGKDLTPQGPLNPGCPNMEPLMKPYIE